MAQQHDTAPEVANNAGCGGPNGEAFCPEFLFTFCSYWGLVPRHRGIESCVCWSNMRQKPGSSGMTCARGFGLGLCTMPSC